MFKRYISVLAVFFLFTSTFAQKRTLTAEDYDLWKRAADTEISATGRVIVSSIVTSTGAGDGYIQINDLVRNQTDTLYNGTNPKISADGQYVLFFEKPPYETVYREKKEDVKKDKRAKKKLMIYSVAQGQVIDSIDRVKSFSIPEEQGAFVAITKLADLKPKAPKEKKKKKKRRKRKKDKAKEPKYNKEEYLILYHLNTSRRDTITHIKDMAIADNGSVVYYTRKNTKKKHDRGLYRYTVKSKNFDTLDTSAWRYEDLSVSKLGNSFALKIARDSAHADSLDYRLHYSRSLTAPLTKLDSTVYLKDEKTRLTPKRNLMFAESGKRLFFHTQPKIAYTIDTTLLEENIPQVDVWNYKDLRIQPEQEVRKRELAQQSSTLVLDMDSGKVTDLQTYEMDNLIMDRKRENRYIVARDRRPYSIQRSWDYPWRADYYAIDTQDGSKKKIITNAGGYPRLSPDGKYAVIFDYDQGHWMGIDLVSGEKINLTQDLNVNFYQEKDDHPALPPSHGFGGFDKKGNALIYDEFDIWEFDLAVGSAANLTKTGRQDSIVYRTHRLDRDQDHVTYEDGRMLLRGFDENSKERFFALLEDEQIKPWVGEEGYAVSAFAKAKKSGRILFTKRNFSTYPDTYTIAPNEPLRRITDINPQQEEFLWGTVEMVNWTAYDGTPLEGLLYKPENFDPNKKYPMIVYFYEQVTDRLLSYRSPQPTASVVNPSFYVSNGYLIFMPDIVYEDGKPGPSAYNCIVSGTEAMVEKGFVDESKMGLQGQSWGGYQTAYLVGVTDKYAAAMAGAPVSNMTSAYGGIRWGSGLNRAFQYERTQSRIGKNLWEGFDLYIENSPLFNVPDITTPLLMMHNDEDGAVPYYQGIEMFMAMRRLNKPAWLLVYNKEAHNLRKTKNRRDLSRRMKQFFDHYLMDEPAPVWMTRGLPYTRKGKQLGYEIDSDTGN